MEIDIFTICDFAQDVNGKLNIVGTFDTINAHKLPAIQPTFSIATRIRLSKADPEQSSFRLSIIDFNNKEIIPPFEGGINIPAHSTEKERAVNIVVGIGQLKFNAYGEYLVKLAINNKEIKSLPFTVKEIQ